MRSSDLGGGGGRPHEAGPDGGRWSPPLVSGPRQAESSVSTGVLCAPCIHGAGSLVSAPERGPRDPIRLASQAWCGDQLSSYN